MDKFLYSNKRLIIISFTEEGTRLNERLCRELDLCVCEGYGPERFAEKLTPLPGNIREWIASQWGKNDFLFIGAVGIAIRMIAPLVKDKYTDSAVLSMDERGQYVIPLLSGHIGGGVELAEKIADWTGALPVITTATDVQKKFAVDVFARENHLVITDRELAKCISAAVLEGKHIGIYVDTECENWIGDMTGRLQQFEELRLCRNYEELEQFEYGIRIGQNADKKGQNVLYLLPQNIVVGIGCRKGTERATLMKGISETLIEHSIRWEQIAAVVSINLKAQEPGLLELCKERNLPFITYSAEELKEVGSISSSSKFVEQVTGVDNVCERAVKRYLKAYDGGTVIQEKRCLEEMTIAIGRWI